MSDGSIQDIASIVGRNILTNEQNSSTQTSMDLFSTPAATKAQTFDVEDEGKESLSSTPIPLLHNYHQQSLFSELDVFFTRLRSLTNSFHQRTIEEFLGSLLLLESNHTNSLAHSHISLQELAKTTFPSVLPSLHDRITRILEILAPKDIQVEDEEEAKFLAAFETEKFENKSVFSSTDTVQPPMEIQNILSQVEFCYTKEHRQGTFRPDVFSSSRLISTPFLDSFELPLSFFVPLQPVFFSLHFFLQMTRGTSFTTLKTTQFFDSSALRSAMESSISMFLSLLSELADCFKSIYNILSYDVQRQSHILFTSLFGTYK